MPAGSVADYVGRTVDILAFDGLELGGDVLLDQVLAQPGRSGKVVTGIQKLVQRFLLEFLKERGSDPYSARGTTFMIEARSGYLNSVTDIHLAFSGAVLQAGINLQEEESDSDPDEERYASAELVQVQFVYGSAKLWIKLLSRAGEDRAIILPVEFPI